jgi:hypothetical protein
MQKKYATLLPSWQLRTRAALNIVKAELLGPEHAPQFHQASLVSEVLLEKFHAIGRGTWTSWWDCKHRMQPQHLPVLDRVVNERFGKRNGAMTALIDGTAFDSAIHQHFAAIDAAGYCAGATEEEWLEERERHSMRVLTELHQQWRPGPSGELRIFSEPAKHGRLKHRVLVSSEARLAYDVFAPASVASFLYRMAFDQRCMADFMLQTWALDLASSTLALWGLVYCMRHEFFMSPTFRYYRNLVGGLLSLFFDDEDKFSLEQVAHNFDENELFDETPGAFDYLLEARALYKGLLDELGIDRMAINEIRNVSSERWPTTFGKS